MKRIFALLCAAVVCVSLCGCAPSLSDSFDETELIDETAGIVEALAAKEYAAVCGEMADVLLDVLPEETLRSALDDTLGSLGGFVGMTGYTAYSTFDKAYPDREVAVVVAICEFQNGTSVFTLSYYTDLKLVGLYMK